MKQASLISQIVGLLVQFSQEVKDKGKLKLTDINIISEDVLVPILSIAYDTDLINLNTKHTNYPGIDLATDEHTTFGGTKKKIAFQITSTSSIEKIKKTLNGYIKGEFYKKFDEIYIYNLIEKQDGYQKASIQEINTIIGDKFNFDLSKNIIDRTDLEAKINTLTPISKIEAIHKLLEDQFVYKKKSLLSLEIWESDGKLGYGFSNLLNSINLTTYHTLLGEGLPTDAKDLLQLLLVKYNNDFAQNYNNEQKDKFRNLAFNTYLKAGFEQAENSFQVIKDNITTSFDKEKFINDLSESFNRLNTTLDESNFPLVNVPTNHPAILFIKETILKLFSTSEINVELKDLFLKDFNSNIERCVIIAFGSSEVYHSYLEETRERWFRENEKDLLLYMKDLAKLGFVEGEELEYQETFGTWQDVRKYGINEEDFDQDIRRAEPEDEDSVSKIQPEEPKLKSVESLINEYFESYKNGNDDYLNNILFLIADFGKGKTSFLHHFTSKLAHQYLKTHEGLFPIYINLNEYDKYSNSASLGIIANYLAKRFRIDIKDEYFKKKNYFFLLDSLDECGELTETNIERVIKDIIEIQNLDNINQRNNQIVIASRPIAKGLKEQITKYKPFQINIFEEGEGKKTKKKETTENYISVYGFKKQQFDSYIEFALKKHISTNSIDIQLFTGISLNIFTKILKGESIDLYKELYNKVLKQSELKRPIFAYMIYKLIISNSNFIDFGKVGVYISFLNQLSRDAKHKDDVNHKVSLKDEFVYRNILHASSLLWQYKRQSGEQTSLTKADICRTIKEDEIDKDNRKVLAEFNDIDSIHFLSHSYLGEKEDTLHFQHQSFAEILLAEYYLKVIIKYAIEEDTNYEDARIRLSVGIPTDQTIDFFIGLLALLKECVLGNPKDNNVCAKRELLIPLLASMAIKKHNNKLYSTRLNATWFEKYEDDIFSNNKLTEAIIKDFPITLKILNKIELLCENIIKSSKSYFLSDPSRHTILFKNELTSIENSKANFNEIDKWLALIAGNALGTDNTEKLFFNSKIEALVLFNLVKNWNYHSGNIPYWGHNLFLGINMRNNQKKITLESLNLNGIDFSYSFIKELEISNSQLCACKFSNSTFEYFNLHQCDIRRTTFKDFQLSKNFNSENSIEFEGVFSLTFCFIEQGILFPERLNNILKGTNEGYVNFGPEYSEVKFFPFEFHRTGHISSSLEGIFKYIIQKTGKSNEIHAAFKFPNEKTIKSQESKNVLITMKRKFKEFIDGIEEEVSKEKIS